MISKFTNMTVSKSTSLKEVLFKINKNGIMNRKLMNNKVIMNKLELNNIIDRVNELENV